MRQGCTLHYTQKALPKITQVTLQKHAKKNPEIETQRKNHETLQKPTIRF